MEKIATQKEILLVTNNSFAQREWQSKEVKGDKHSAQEQMEEACANGLIYEILPEVFAAPENTKLYLWQMRPGFSFIQLQYGEFPLALKKAASIDPHEWLAGYCYN